MVGVPVSNSSSEVLADKLADNGSNGFADNGPEELVDHGNEVTVSFLD